jgi:hypothetical protein
MNFLQYRQNSLQQKGLQRQIVLEFVAIGRDNYEFYIHFLYLLRPSQKGWAKMVCAGAHTIFAALSRAG